MKLKKANKYFIKDNKKIVVLDDISYDFQVGKLYMIIGSSGAGKSTLINILGLLDTLNSGSLLINDIKIDKLNDKELAKIRKENIGLIFQDYYLNPRLNAYDNILMALLINDKIKRLDRDKLITKLLKSVGLEDRGKHYPYELSGGEQQRVCILRAIVNEPKYILADEPTGSLDLDNSKQVMDILKKLTKRGKCVILVTHDLSNKKYADVVLKLENGKLIEV